MSVAARGRGFSYCVSPCPAHNNATGLNLVYVASADDDWWLASSLPLANVSCSFSSVERDAMVAFVN